MSSRIHDYDRLVQRQEDLLEHSKIAKKDKLLIRRFVTFKIAEGISLARTVKYYSTLRLVAENLMQPGKSFEEIGQDDIIELAAKIERMKVKAWTKRDYKLLLKVFLSWLGKDAHYMKPKDPSNKLIPEDLITKADVQKMLNASLTDRDRALISCIYEGAFRISEIGSARIRDVSFDSYGAKLTVDGKTGMRSTRLIVSMPYLAKWLDSHPRRDDRNAPLWVMTKDSRPMSYMALYRQLGRIAKRAGIAHKVNPHNFRHSRATQLAQHLSESLLCQYMGLIQGSKQVRTYVHLSGRDLDRSLMKMHGLEADDQKEKELEVVQCPFCRTINTPDARICLNCRRTLSTERALEQEAGAKMMLMDLLELSLSDPEVAAILQRHFEKREK